MPTRLFSFLLVLVVFPLPGFAQVFDMQKDRVPMTVLDGPVRFHTGDDADGRLGWASPGLDDSSWPLISSGKGWSAQGYKGYGGFAWYRFHVVLPEKHRQLALYIPLIETSYQVFADGRLIGQAGGLPPHQSVHWRPTGVFLLPAETTGSVVIAIRVWHWPQWAMYVPGGFRIAPRIGDADLIADWHARDVKLVFWRTSATSYATLLYILAGIGGVVLYLLRRKDREYLWFGAYELFSGAAGLVLLYRNFYDTQLDLYEALQELLSYAALLCFVAFLFLVLRSRRSRWYWVAVTSVVLVLLTMIPGYAKWISVSVWNGLSTGAQLPFFVAILLLLTRSARRRDPDALLLLIPVGLAYAVDLTGNIAMVANTAGYGAAREFLNWWNSVAQWPFPMGMPDIADTLMQLSVFGILLLRFARSRRDEERLKNELEAARAVQQVLVPEEIPTIPGFAIEAVYHPAGEVGGDFFQIIPAASGGVLVVVGDVSGKGMPAAMTVSLLVGAFRTLAESTADPAAILCSLNRRTVDRSNGGFTTALVLRLDPDGTLTAANAGHLSPYANGKELEIENGLPLGITASVAYSNSTLHLAHGTTLTLLSDGVVEAQNSEGELFGFDRTAAASTESVETVAMAARAFGQQDDITVLSLALVAAG
ncbi:MAG TPA: SpoIIE family protein phosphatase [Terracidiphilus sp.]|nr:SpoIIE family protein phosphatase [Terracidiphilus sp.]